MSVAVFAVASLLTGEIPFPDPHRMNDGADVWLWVRSEEPLRLVEAIEAHADG